MLPIAIQGLLRTRMRIEWEDGHVTEIPARDLRLACGCATCKDEWTGKPLVDEAKIPRMLTIQELSVVGQYGVNVRFSDGHATGIYRFADLRAACPCAECAARRETRPR